MEFHKGTLIAVDGGDNVGKATQADLLMRRLIEEDIAVGKLDFPRYSQNTFGHVLQDCLKGDYGDFMGLHPKIASTLYAADRFESKGQLEEWLEEERVVVLDRYVSANMLHQGAKFDDPDEREEFLKWLDHVEYEIFGMPRPDLTIYLEVPPEQSQKLLEYVVEIGADTADIAEADTDHRKKVAACANYLSQSRDKWITIHCLDDSGTLRSREDIHEEVFAIVKDNMK